jgi:septum formation protein
MLILASQSPRRAQILRDAGIEFSVRPASVDETPREGESPIDYVERLAEEKAAAVAAMKGEIVLGADTTVVAGGEILGKPVDEADARRMLRCLSGRRHEVITGICLKRGTERIRDSAVTEVWFSAMSDEEIAEYAATGEPLDKAGGYAIQGLASKYIDKINGCYFNVVGLPVAMVYAHLRYLTNNTELPRSL